MYAGSVLVRQVVSDEDAMAWWPILYVLGLIALVMVVLVVVGFGLLGISGSVRRRAALGDADRRETERSVPAGDPWEPDEGAWDALADGGPADR